MDTDIDVDYDLLDFQEHQATEKASKSDQKRGKRGRQVGSGEDGEAIAKEEGRPSRWKDGLARSFMHCNRPCQ